jgi:hypothetical protein
MAIAILVVALIFLIGGGSGLFYVNTHIEAWSQLWWVGNIAFGTFALAGIVTCVFLALFNAEFE